MNDEKFLSQKQWDFILSVLMKEMYFAIYSQEDTDLAQMLRTYVQIEKDKIDEGIFGEGYEADSLLASRILEKLTFTEEEPT